MPILILLLLLIELVPAHAQHSFPYSKPDQGALPSQWQWTKEEWTTEGDAPLRAWRDQMETRYTSVDIPATVVEQCKQEALQAPQDRSKLFHWGYTAYLLYSSDPAQSKDLQLTRTLFHAKPPYSYEFMRMHYLVEKSQGFGDEHTTALGERLAKADPKDYIVRAYLCRSFRPDTPDGRRKALAYAQELIELNPNRASGYGAFATIYYNAWILSAAKDTDAARQAVQNYRRYIQLENRPNRVKDKKVAQGIIDHLNTYIARAERGNAEK